MSRQIFLVIFLLLFVCCKLCEQKCAANRVPEPVKTNDENTFSDFLKPEESGNGIEVLDSDGEKQEKIKIKNIDSVFLVAADGLMVAVAEVRETVQEEKLNISTKFFEIGEGDDWGSGAIRNERDNTWNVQLAAKDLDKTKGSPVIKSFVVVAKKNKIYYITVNVNIFKNIVQLEPSSSTSAEWHVRLVEGEVCNNSKNKKTIKWTTSKICELKKDTKQKLNTQPTEPLSCDSFGFVGGEEENVYFGIQCNAADGSNNKNITSVFQLEESGKKKELKLLHVDDTKNCHFSLFLWEKHLVMTPTVCSTSDENQKMMLFNPANNEFNKNEKLIARLQEFLKDKENFVTTKIDTETEVLLFTQKKAEKSNVYLWVTNGNRTAKVGTIITEITDKFDVSILYINKELFALHKQKKGSDTLDNTKYDLKRLPELLTEINIILNAWRNTDKEIKDLFQKTDSTEAVLFTHGLVGFLSGNGQNNKYWKDENFYEDATVTGNGTRAEKGFRFSGKGAGAKWLVGKAIEDQPYNFADSGFTLVATVKIYSNANKRDNSVLGVEIKESNTDKKYNIGLWCNADNKWAVSDGSNPKKILFVTEKCVQEETYQVVLTMKNKHVSMYIDGEKMEELPQDLKTSRNPLNIAHFYFGADITATDSSATDESHVTITNVLLYDRPFDEEKEINELKKYVTIKKDTTPPNGNTTPQEGGNDEVSPTVLLSTNENEKKEKEEKVPSPSRTEDGDVGGGVRVFSLLLAVLCVSAPLLHL